MSRYTPISDRTFEFAVRITKLCSYLDKQQGTSRLLANQLFRTGTSVGAIIYNQINIFHNNNNKRRKALIMYVV